MNKSIIHVVGGPTAAGKTKFAIELAREIDGELINADSRQIYKYLDIGTNKGNLKSVSAENLLSTQYPVFDIENSSIPIHLLSFLEPNEQFNAFQFRALALAAIKKVIDKGKSPVLVGGTGLYLQVVMDPTFAENTTPPDPKLREELEGKTVTELQKLLPPETLNSLNNSDRNNPIRLVRLLEKLKSEPITGKQQIEEMQLLSEWTFEKHLITKPLDELTDRIDTRVEEMWDQGIVTEVQKVLDLGFNEGCPALTGSGYPAILQYLHGELDVATCKEQIKLAHRQVAKKQITWFKKYF